MIARRAKQRGRESVVAVVIVACALAGCTSGPGTQTAKRDANTDGTVIAKSQPEEHSQSRTIAKRWRAMFQRPKWLNSLVNNPEPAPADPFVMAKAESRREAANVLVDYTPVAIQPVDFRKPAFMSGLTPWGARRDEGLDCTPVISGPPRTAIPNRHRSRSHLQNNRPDNDTAPAPTAQHVEPRTSWARPNRPQTQTVTLSDYLNGAPDRSTGFAQQPSRMAERSNRFVDISTNFAERSNNLADASQQVIHGDMIVNSAAVPWQFEPRHFNPPTRTTSAEEPIQTISAERPRRDVPPRRPFFESDDRGAGWSESRQHPSVSANVPVSVTPAIPRPAERTSFSSYRMYHNRTPLFMEAREPRQTVATGDPFAAIQGKSPGLASQEKPAPPSRKLAAALSPNPRVVEAPRPRPARQLAEVVAEPAKPLACALNLKRAKQVAKQQAKNPATPDIRTPAAVGVGLAAVIIGAAMIRARLA